MTLKSIVVFVAAALAVPLVLEAVLRVLPTPTATKSGYHVDPDILNYPPRHRWTVSYGWDLRNAQTLSANNVGFPDRRDYVADANAVALVGDSFVEASMLPPEARPGAQLEAALGGRRPVYALGGPGSSLLDYAERIRFAAQRLGVHDFVVLMESADVRQAVCGSGNVHSACVDAKTLEPRNERTPLPSLVKKIARESAFAQYFAGQLRIDMQRLIKGALPPPPSLHGLAPAAVAPAAASAAAAAPAIVVAPYVEKIATLFFERVKPNLKGRLVIVIDTPRYASGRLAAELAAERERFAAIARDHGAIVVDAGPLYAMHQASSARSLEVGPYDRHLNALGNALVMGAAARELQ